MGRSARGWAALSLGIVALAAAIEWLLGRVPVYAGGPVHFWVSEVNGPENSQQFTDWYSFSHLIHGFIFYALARWIGRGRWPLGARFTLSTGVEAAWEVLENTPFIIDRYRAATVSLQYYGDSILNSVSDMACCALGFGLARVLPVWITVTLALGMELGVGYTIRDNLALNVLMLVHPLETVRHWQQGM